MGILSDLGTVWTGAKKVIGGDWRGFQDVYSGVSSLFEGADAYGGLEVSQYRKPQVSLMQYQVGTTVPGSAQKIGQLGDTSMISDWSRNQAVAQYYLDHILRITKQGSPRKGA